MTAASESVSLLSDLSDALREQYRPGFVEQYDRMQGSMINQIVTPNTKMRIGGDGLRIQMLTRRFGGVRHTADVLSDLSSPGTIKAQKLRIRFAEGSPEAQASRTNDTTRFDSAIAVTQVDLDEAHRTSDPVESIINIAERLKMEAEEEVDDAMAMSRVLGIDGVVAQVNGNMENGSAGTYHTGGTFTANATTVRVLIDNGSIAAFRPGREFWIEDSSGNNGIAVTVVSYNTQDNSVVFERRAGGAADFGGTNSAYNNGNIYFGDASGRFMYGPGAWASQASSGESFIGGVDRTSSDWHFLNPTYINQGGSTNAPLTKADIDSLARKMQFINTDPSQPSMVFFTDLEMHDALRNEIGDQVVNDAPPSFAGNVNFGTEGVGYVHPLFGKVRFVSDPLAKPKTFWAMKTDHWESYHVLGPEFQWLPGNTTGIWTRRQDAGASAPNLHYIAQGWIPGVVDVCLRPQHMGVILDRV